MRYYVYTCKIYAYIYKRERLMERGGLRVRKEYTDRLQVVSMWVVHRYDIEVCVAGNIHQSHVIDVVGMNGKKILTTYCGYSMGSNR